ncbi:hypothetical protein Ddye_027692 [Dipteronia dyeriana]|uniref:TIR domain-containing protein n=1 Tax=Dipteronia dyeriana TaxID=168575 RepID=A0AAD9TQ19_9ROSI|nr:hypothetical protein Ddye_027692 [Dipteronia dyeriana]
MKCKKLHELIVMPVFYHVDPSDVRKLKGSFKCSFANEENELQEEVQKWREALTEASNVAGWDSSVIRTESKLVGDIVESVWRKLMNKYTSASSDFEGLIGIHKRIEHVLSLLCLDMEDVRIIGIWGMGGIDNETTTSPFQRETGHFVSSQEDSPTSESPTMAYPGLSLFSLNISSDDGGGSLSQWPVGVKKSK